MPINITEYIYELNHAVDRIDELMKEPNHVIRSVKIKYWTDHVRYIAGEITKEVGKEKDDNS